MSRKSEENFARFVSIELSTRESRSCFLMCGYKSESTRVWRGYVCEYTCVDGTRVLSGKWVREVFVTFARSNWLIE